jgi:hypothetical protein
MKMSEMYKEKGGMESERIVGESIEGAAEMRLETEY